jgi:2-oxoisovalerate dehydrogenase E1 component alpha subunit
MSTQVERSGATSNELDPAPDQLLQAYQWMLLARRLDERMWQLIRQGKGHFAVPCQGHEAVGAGYALALRRGLDYIAPHYRDLAAVLAFGITPRDALASFFARAADPNSRGRQPYAHWGSQQLRIISLQGPQPNHVTHAVGVAYAAKLLGEESVTLMAYGDGGAQKGEVHEAMNFASIHHLPCIFVCQNNLYTQSVPLALESSISSIAARAAAYGFPGVSIDGMDILAVYQAVASAAERARSDAGPTLIETRVYRYRPNTSNDDDTRYRSREEVEQWRERDPLLQFQSALQQRGLLTQAQIDDFEQQAMAAVDDAVTWAETTPDPAPDDALLHTYAEGTPS